MWEGKLGQSVEEENVTKWRAIQPSPLRAHPAGGQLASTGEVEASINTLFLRSTSDADRRFKLLIGDSSSILLAAVATVGNRG